MCFTETSDEQYNSYPGKHWWKINKSMVFNKTEQPKAQINDNPNCQPWGRHLPIKIYSLKKKKVRLAYNNNCKGRGINHSSCFMVYIHIRIIGSEFHERWWRYIYLYICTIIVIFLILTWRRDVRTWQGRVLSMPK